MSKQEIRNKIIEILDNKELVFPKKAFEIYALTDKMSAQVGFEFLDIYSERFNEAVSERMASKDIARIMSASFPFTVPEFVKFIGQDPQRIVEFSQVVKKFVKSFPYTHMDVMKIYHLPALTASFFFADEEVRSVFQNMDAEVTDHHYGIMISSAILSKRDESLYQIINGMNQSLLSPHVLFEIVEAGNYNWKVISSILEKLNLNMDKQISFSHKDKTLEMTFPAFIALQAVTTGNAEAFELFNTVASQYKLNYLIPEKFSVNNKSVNAPDFVSFFNSLNIDNHNYFKILNVVLNEKSLPPTIYTNIFQIFDTEKQKNISVEMVNKILHHPTLQSPYLNKQVLLEKAFNNMLEEVINPPSSMSLHKNIFTVLKNAAEKDFENIRVFSICLKKGLKNFTNNADVALMMKKDLIDNFESYKEIFSDVNGKPLDIENTEHDLYTFYQFIKAQNFIVKNTIRNEVGGFFSKKVDVYDTFEWDMKVINNREKFGKVKAETYSFLTSDSGEKMNLNLINILPNKHLQKLADNLVMMAYQFSNFSNDPLLSYSEESYFLKNNLPTMFNRIIGNYEEFKLYDEKNAEENLTAQLLMLQKKTAQCIKVVVTEEHQDLETQSKVTHAILEGSLAMTAKP